MEDMSEVAPLISDLAVILIAAGVVTVLFKWLKQPVVLGYIVAGILAGPAVPFLPTVADTANIKIWADIGVIFLLFAMGLEFSFRKLVSVGSTAVVAAVVIVSGMMFVGYSAGNLMSFSHITSIFLGGMLSMSSTAIVFKAFDDLGLREQKFAGVVLGVLVWYLRKGTFFVRLRQFLLGVKEGLLSVRDVEHKSAFIAYTLFIWLMYFLMLYLCFFCFDFTSGLGPLVGLTVFVLSSYGMVAPVQGGVGAYHFMVIAALAIYLPHTQEIESLSKAFALLTHGTMTLLYIVVGCLCLLLLPIYNRNKH